jgi:uncharacterized membrane protein YccC
MRRLVPFALGGVALGVVLGLLVGWVVWPVRYTNTSPTQLRQDYRNDYVLMAAAAYQTERDLTAARERLARLDPEQPARPVVELAEQLIAAGGSAGDIRVLARLADALNAATPPMAPYLEEEQ